MGALRLASLTLEGFKSFAVRAELSFPGAIVAIVGPNGAGKSNVADSLSWVLGEQSARLLRSQNMADVIFAGSPQRSPLGAAVVTLQLSASDGRWVDTDGKLEISRRVYRDGTSEYRIAGKRARLKDVLDRLMDAGLGTRSYAIIEQGRIGQVLSVRAIERRALFEEAAGITKYRARRHEAELKLAETRANLLRLADIASEVRRSLESARRQARRAEKYRDLKARLELLRCALFSIRRETIARILEERRNALVESQTQEAAASTSLATADAELEKLRRELDAAHDQLSAARDVQATSDALAQRREAEEGAARRELSDAHERRKNGLEEAHKIAALAESLAHQETRLASMVESAEAAVLAAEQAAKAAIDAALDKEKTSKSASEQAEDARRALLASASAATEGANRTHRLQVELEQVAHQRTRLTAEQERLSAHLAQVATSTDEAAKNEISAKERSQGADEERLNRRSTSEKLAQKSSELTAERDKAGHQRWQAQHEREGVERALVSARALPQALARILPAEKLIGAVADYLDPEAEVARLIDRAYGDLLNLPVCTDENAIINLIEGASKSEGKLEVIVADRTLVARVSNLLDHAGAKPEDLGWLTVALPRAVEADSLDQARELAAGDPDMVVLLPEAGRRRGARVELPGKHAATPGVLELRLRQRDAAERERIATLREEELVCELESVQKDLAQTNRLLATSDAAVRQASEALAAASSAYQAHSRERNRLQREVEALTAEGTRLAGETNTLSTRLETARQEAERLALRASEHEVEVDARAREAERERDAAALSRADAERFRGQLAVARERLGAARRELEHHRQELAGLQEREATARNEVGNQEKRALTAQETAVRSRVELEELLARRSVAQREVETASERAERLKEQVATTASLADRCRSNHLASRDATHAVELALTEALSSWERLHEAIALTLGSGVELPEHPPRPEEVPHLEADEKTIVGEIETLGPVNELAVVERDELEQRHKFLGEQRKDLEKSLETLTQTVQELDVTCAERFLATLAEANIAFDQVFRELFGGGEAKAELSDPEAPLESGIEIRVRPPGKHTQSVLLLSGGEKALAAIALLVALFRIRPAPFCLLDEVDAPLDDANVERLCRLLRDMSNDTQFILITHNRRTMSYADVLYGVTMEEPGVSRIVSVRLED